MKGVILAAGKGTRLYPITRRIPKPLLPLANRPTIAYAFQRLKEMGVEDVCVVVGESEPAMREVLGDGSAFGVRLAYARQVDPHGLAHALGFARSFVGEDNFVLYLGDAIYGDGFAAYRKRFEESGCANLDIVKPVADPSRFGVAELDGERIVRLVEKPAKPASNLAMAGLYFFGPQIWGVLPRLQPSARGEYEITDAIQMLIDEGETVLAGIYEGAWFDTGTLDSFLATSEFLVRGECLIASGSSVQAELGESVVIGERCLVRCGRIEDSVVLPDSDVEVAGDVRHCILTGRVRSRNDLERLVVDGDERQG